MNHGISGFDHLVVAVRDLETARDAWTRLGFTCTPRGRHRNLATGNYCIMFPKDYIELIGIVDPSMPDRGLTSRMDEGGEGLDRVAFAVRNVDATADALTSSGVGFRGPIDLHRPLELPEGEVEPRFRLIHFEDQQTTPGLHGFICYHETPEITRGEPAWLSHANGVNAVRSLTVVNDNPEQLAQGWQDILGPGCTVLTDDTITVHTGDHAVIFVTPDHLPVMFPRLADKGARKAPFIAGANFLSTDVEAAATFLTGNGVAFQRDVEGSIHIPPSEANGAIIAIEQAPRT